MQTLGKNTPCPRGPHSLAFAGHSRSAGPTGLPGALPQAQARPRHTGDSHARSPGGAALFAQRSHPASGVPVPHHAAYRLFFLRCHRTFAFRARLHWMWKEKNRASVGAARDLNLGLSSERVPNHWTRATLSRLIILPSTEIPYLPVGFRSGECLKFQSRPHCPQLCHPASFTSRIFSYFSPLETTLVHVCVQVIASGIPDTLRPMNHSP